MVAALVEGYGATASDSGAACSGLGAVGSINDSGTTIRRCDHRRNAVLIAASGLVD